MRGADSHVNHSGFVFYLAHHDAQLLGVPSHPVKHPACGAHGISTVKAHPSGRAPHGERLIALEKCQSLPGIGQRKGKRLEMGICIFVARPSDPHVLGNHRLAFPLELQGEDLFENLKFNANQTQDRGQSNCVLNQITLDVRSQLFDREGAKLDASGGGARFDLVSVVKDSRTGSHQPEMPIHGVLV